EGVARGGHRATDVTTDGQARWSMRGEARNRHHEVEVSPELVDLPHVPGHERRSLRGAQIRARERFVGIGDELGAEFRVLLEPVEQAVHRVTAHRSLHSTAAMLMRGSSPK